MLVVNVSQLPHKLFPQWPLPHSTEIGNIETRTGEDSRCGCTFILHLGGGEEEEEGRRRRREEEEEGKEGRREEEEEGKGRKGGEGLGLGLLTDRGSFVRCRNNSRDVWDGLYLNHCLRDTNHRWSGEGVMV